MEQHGYTSIEPLEGSLSRENCPDPSTYERASSMRSLVSCTGKFIRARRNGGVRSRAENSH